jgi:hypothetical protein
VPRSKKGRGARYVRRDIVERVVTIHGLDLRSIDVTKIVKFSNAPP